MTPQQRSQLIKHFAAQLGFDLCGIAPAGPISRPDFFRRWLAEGRAGTMSYLHRHEESRIDLRKWLPWASNIIVLALNYFAPGESLVVDDKPADQPRGRVARYARGEDYHIVVRDKLDHLVESMRDTLDVAFDSKICVDTSAIIERDLAAAAGIGWIGKNTLVLNSTIGSYFFLGEIITDLPLAPDHPEPDHCGTCTRCLQACPTQALDSPYQMDARKCISYLTIEHRGPIDPALAEKMEDWVFGCDICQEVCPFNHQIPRSTEPRFAGEGDKSAFPPISDISEWDESRYAEFVHGRALDRARIEMWKRNAQIACHNSNG